MPSKISRTRFNMKDLLTYILEGILGNKDFEISEDEDSERTTLSVKTRTEDLGLIIGKGGMTIKAIQTLLRVRGRIDNKLVDVKVLS